MRRVFHSLALAGMLTASLLTGALAQGGDTAGGREPKREKEKVQVIVVPKKEKQEQSRWPAKLRGNEALAESIAAKRIE